MCVFWLGARRAQEVLLGGTLYTADEAQRIGLVEAVEPEGAVIDEARKRVQQHASQEPAAFRSIKMLLRQPVIDAAAAREPQSIREFVDIWYSAPTWRKLQEIKIHA